MSWIVFRVTNGGPDLGPRALVDLPKNANCVELTLAGNPEIWDGIPPGEALEVTVNFELENMRIWSTRVLNTPDSGDLMLAFWVGDNINQDFHSSNNTRFVILAPDDV